MLCYCPKGITAECRVETSKKPHELLIDILEKARNTYPMLTLSPDNIEIVNYDEYILIKVFIHEDPKVDVFTRRRMRLPGIDVILNEILSIFK